MQSNYITWQYNKFRAQIFRFYYKNIKNLLKEINCKIIIN